MTPETPQGAGRSAAWGVVAVVLGGAAVATWIEALSPGSRFPAWPAWAFSALTVAAVYLCFASLSGRWPTGRDLRHGTRPTSLTAPPGHPTDAVVNLQPLAAGAEMVYDIRLNPVKEILVRYIYQAADITMISSQSGLDQGSIAAGGAAVNYWQAVLERACLEGVPKVDAVLNRAIHHLKGTVAEAPLRALVERYRQARD